MLYEKFNFAKFFLVTYVKSMLYIFVMLFISLYFNKFFFLLYQKPLKQFELLISYSLLDTEESQNYDHRRHISGSTSRIHAKG